MADHNKLGKEGEGLAVAYLLEKGYKILEKNYRFQKSEIDIIARKGATLIAVEVKTRTTTYFGAPQEFVNAKKIALLVIAMDTYVVQQDLEVDVRFDIVAITKHQGGFKIAHLKDAFLFF
ncbi:conserved hypothetical protein [Tenacibaculum maritimum]|uniref:YraN family protein n=1 Tax=Tenacibaculum maritimum TaxID=107401 RepID=UPI0012E59670|nr:YraN family protein [Tenacibaculum maritimum]CAA0183802.1 conserved hypothetical protein [Tenacibaculum maritimum]